MKSGLLVANVVALLLSACAMSMGREGMGGMNSMMNRHSAPIPAEYAGLHNPNPSDDASLERGGEIYALYCAPCHGSGGMGDGPAGAELDPLPAPIAHTSRMLGDDYLFWRISEGGITFGTGMPLFKAVFDENQRWDLINYIRALGSGSMQPDDDAGGAILDPRSEEEQRKVIVEKAIADGVISRTEADIFLRVHQLLDDMLASGELQAQEGNAAEVRAAWLESLVTAGDITREDADTFSEVHARLVDAGLMQ